MRGSRPLKAGAGTLTNAGKPLGIGEAGTEPNIGMAGFPLSQGERVGVRGYGARGQAPTPRPSLPSPTGRGSLSRHRLQRLTYPRHRPGRPTKTLVRVRFRPVADIRCM
jgi:hypothetical protein